MKCKICEKTFKVFPSCIKRGRKFCSQKCSGVYKIGNTNGFQKGHTITKDRKQQQKGSKNNNWKGGKRKSNGYVLLYKPNHPKKVYGNYVYRGRYTIEKLLGRCLSDKEIVHHINGVKDDDRIENLQWLPNPSAHRKLHWLQIKLRNSPFPDTLKLTT